MAHSIIQFDYDSSVYGQKTRYVLKAAGVEFSRCDQPVALPRPDLAALGITYRRIPLLAVGKDIYCDTSLITDVIATKLGHVQSSPADKAFEAWSNTCFQSLLTVLPIDSISQDFIKDRETIFPALQRPDYKSLRPSGIANFIARLKQVEDDFLKLAKGPFLYGDKLSVADIQIIWPLRWALKDLGLEKEPGCARAAFPKVWRLIDALPDNNAPFVKPAEAQEIIKKSDYSADGPLDLAENDAYGLQAGTVVAVENDDTTPGAHPQVGKLVGTNEVEIVIELENGIRLHFPRNGYVVRAH